MKILKKIKKIITALIVSVAVFFSGQVFLPANFLHVKAAEFYSKSSDNYNYSYVLDDLAGSIVKDKVFSLDDYKFDRSKLLEVVSFVEYAYSPNLGMQNSYDLFIYIYNPQNLNINLRSSKNSIFISLYSEEHFYPYSLEYINSSVGDNVENLFLKYKVVLTDSQKESFLKTLNSDLRIYYISQINLHEKGKTNATPIDFFKTLTFSGFMPGLGYDLSSSSQLECKEETLKKISFDVFPTYYRPSTYNGGDSFFTQDSLHSVYFSVDNSVESQFGDIFSLHARWIDAYLNPALVLGGEFSVYSSVYDELGKYYAGHNENLNYCFMGGILNGNYPSIGVVGKLFDDFVNPAIYYNKLDSFNFKDVNYDYFHKSVEVNPLYLLFYSGKSDDSADTYSVCSDTLKQQISDSGSKFSGDKVNELYAKSIFSKVNDFYTEKTLTLENSIPLTFATFDEIYSSWWGGIYDVDYIPKSVKCLYKVTDEDLIGNKGDICEKLFISVSDYDNFLFRYNQAKNNNKSTYLFRYKVSDYLSIESNIYEKTELNTWKNIGTNAYFFQMGVDLDFQVIDLTFGLGETKTLMPVFMSPIDIFHDSTSPLDTTSDKSINLINKILALVALVLIVVLIGPFLSPILTIAFNLLGKLIAVLLKALGLIFKFIWSILTFPFRLLKPK